MAYLGSLNRIVVILFIIEAASSRLAKFGGLCSRAKHVPESEEILLVDAKDRERRSAAGG